MAEHGSSAVPSYYRGSVYGAVRQTAERYPQHTALNFLGRKFSYTALLEHIGWFAASLEEAGVQKGDVVAVMLPNCPQAAVAFYAANKIGAIASMIHPLLSAAELQHALELTDAKLLVTMVIFYESALKVTESIGSQNGRQLMPIVATRIVDELPFYARGVFRVRAKKNDLPPHKVVDGGRTRTYRSFLRAGKKLCEAGRRSSVSPARASFWAPMCSQRSSPTQKTRSQTVS